MLNKTVLVLPFVMFALLFFSASLLWVHADRGGFSPNWERVSESDQKAIIAWNGTREILILSTDVSSSQESEVVEIMPLPLNPSISKGETASFLEVQELVNTYFVLNSKVAFRYGPQFSGLEGKYSSEITITFQETIGVHYLTVVKAEEPSMLLSWLKDFLESKGYTAGIPPDLDKLIGNYTNSEVNFFVIDMIKTNATLKTVDPLIYEFDSPKLYYPLQISNLFYGNTDISLFTLTGNELKDDPILGGKFVKKAQFQIKQEHLAKISINFVKLFSSNPYLCYFKFSGPISSLNEDAQGESQSNFDTSTAMLATLNTIWGSLLLFMFLPGSTRLRPMNVSMPISTRLQVMAFLTGLVGILLMWVGFILPWGLAEFGHYGELLLPLNGPYVTSQFGDIFSFLYLVHILAASFCYIYQSPIHGNSERTSIIFTALGASAMLLMLISCSFVLYTTSIGAFTTLTGCLFIMVAGLLFLLRAKLYHKEPSVGKMTRFQAYLIDRILISMVTLIGVALVIFWIISILPPGLRSVLGI